MSTEMELPEEIFPLTQIKRILDSYYSQLPPKGGTSCSFTIPGEAKPFTFYCPVLFFTKKIFFYLNHFEIS